MIEQKEIKHPYKLPCKFFIQVDFPPTVEWNRNTYFATGKEGVNKSDIPCAEYSRHIWHTRTEERVWLDAHGHIKGE